MKCHPTKRRNYIKGKQTIKRRQKKSIHLLPMRKKTKRRKRGGSINSFFTPEEAAAPDEEKERIRQFHQERMRLLREAYNYKRKLLDQLLLDKQELLKAIDNAYMHLIIPSSSRYDRPSPVYQDSQSSQRLASLQANLKDTEYSIARLTTELDGISRQIAQRGGSTDSSNLKEAIAPEYEKERIRQHYERIGQLQRDQAQLQRELEEEQLVKQEYEEEIEQLLEEIDNTPLHQPSRLQQLTLKMLKNNLQSTQSIIDNYIEELNEIQRQIAQRGGNNDEIQPFHQPAEVNVDEIEEEYDVLFAEYEQALNELQQAEQKFQQALEQNQEVDLIEKRIQGLKQNISAMMQELDRRYDELHPEKPLYQQYEDRIEKEIQKREEQNEPLQEKIDQKQEILSRLQKKWRSIEREFLKCKNPATKKCKALQAQLKDYKQKIYLLIMEMRDIKAQMR